MADMLDMELAELLTKVINEAESANTFKSNVSVRKNKSSVYRAKENNFVSILFINKVISEREMYALKKFFENVWPTNEDKYWYSRKGVIRYKSLIKAHIKAYSS